MIADSQEYAECESILQCEITKIRALLPQNDIAAIEHYLSHAEIEMAFESLGLSLIQHQVALHNNTSQVLRKLGLRLSLDKESVFDDKFWIAFDSYLNTSGSICGTVEA